ncbi:hypothetical protein BDZ45DRAFT_72021 [Acephala macrosclerotiorum]|nr:hypothetical protein BDZ45DRAFT_72021 [Acephala macrosclerotiorum]
MGSVRLRLNHQITSNSGYFITQAMPEHLLDREKCKLRFMTYVTIGPRLKLESCCPRSHDCNGPVRGSSMPWTSIRKACPDFRRHSRLYGGAPEVDYDESQHTHLRPSFHDINSSTAGPSRLISRTSPRGREANVSRDTHLEAGLITLVKLIGDLDTEGQWYL